MTDTHRPWGDLTPEEQDAILRERDKADAERFRWLVIRPRKLRQVAIIVSDMGGTIAGARAAIDAAMREDAE